MLFEKETRFLENVAKMTTAFFSTPLQIVTKYVSIVTK